VTMMPLRVLLGGIAGLLFHSQVNGMPAAVEIGSAAPMLLLRLGRGAGSIESSEQAEVSQNPVIEPRE